MVISTAPYVNNPTCPPSQVCEPEHGDQHCALREQPDLSPPPRCVSLNMVISTAPYVNNPTCPPPRCVSLNMVISTAPYVNNPTCPPSQVREPEHGDQHCALREQPDLSPLPGV